MMMEPVRVILKQRVCAIIVEEKRKEAGMASLKQVGREPTYIATAADEHHRLGCKDLSKIRIIRV